MIAIWCISTWKCLGSPPKIRLIELGPGNGTLMKDILRCSQSFSDFKNALSVEMVELSEHMRRKQQETLQCPVFDREKLKNHPEMLELLTATENTNNIQNSKQLDIDKVIKCNTKDNISVSWYTSLKNIPMDKDIPMLFIGQEFLDAFPVHHLVNSSTSGWTEKFIDIDSSSTSPYHFKVVLSPSNTPASRIYVPYIEVNSIQYTYFNQYFNKSSFTYY